MTTYSETVNITVPEGTTDVQLGINIGIAGACVPGGGGGIGNLVTNGDFSDGTTGWTAEGCDIAVVDGSLVIDNLTQSPAYVRSAVTTSFGQALDLTYTGSITDGTAVRIGLNNGGRNTGGDNITTGTATERNVLFANEVASTQIEIIVLGDASTVATIDDISMVSRELGDEVVLNGTFDANVDGWTAQSGNTRISWDAGELEAVSSDTASSYVYQNIVVENAKTYIASMESDTTSTQFVVWREIDLSGATEFIRNNAALKRADLFTGSGSNMSMGVRPTTSPLTWRLDNMSIREVLPL